MYGAAEPLKGVHYQVLMIMMMTVMGMMEMMKMTKCC